GQEKLGGDWDLEFITGSIESTVAISADTQQSWNSLLAETIYESNTNVDAGNEIKSDNPTGQSFSHTSGSGSYNVNRISLQLYNDGASSQTLTVSLRSTWNGADLGSATISSDSLTGSYATYNFDFADVSLTDGATYYIRITSDTTSGEVYYATDESDNYAGSVHEQVDEGGNAVGGKDIYFIVSEVVPDNNAPTASNNTVTTNEDATYTFSASEFNFSDIDGDTLASIKITTLEAVGALQLFGVDVTLNQVITKADIDAGNLKFVPVADANGTGYDSFGFSVNDGTTDSAGTYTQTVDVTAVNDAPVANNDNYSVSEDQTLIINALTVNTTATDLEAAWQFEEGAEATTIDTTGNGNDGTINGATWTTSSRTGDAALSFDGANDYVETTGTTLDLSTATNFTLSAWFQTDTTAGQHHILWQGVSTQNGWGSPSDNTPTSSEMNLTVGRYDADDNITFFMGYDTNDANSIDITSSNFTDTSGWHQAVVVVTDLGFGTLQADLYVDGVLEGSDTGNQTDRSKWDSDLLIGQAGSATRLFDGMVDEVGIYDRALSAAEISALYFTGLIANDTDVENDVLSAVLVSGPFNGLLALNAEGSFTYTPNADFVGTDTFTYMANDGNSDSNVATVTITVIGVNDAPTATNLSASETYTEDTALNLADIVVSDVDSANVTVTLTLSDVGAGSLSTGTSNAVTSTFVAGVWTASGAKDDVNTLLAGVTFTPTANYNSNFNILTSVDDSVAAAITGTKVMTGTAVNDAPTGSVTISGTPTEDQMLTASNTLADADGLGIISYQWQRDGLDIGGATNSTYTLGDADVGTIITVVASYTDVPGTAESVPSAGVGPIANVNDAPLLSVDDAPIYYLTGTLDIDPILTITDVDDTMLESAQVQFGNGFKKGHDRLRFVDQSGITGTYNNKNGTLTLTGTAIVAQYETALRSVQYEDINTAQPAQGILLVHFSVFDGTDTSIVDTRVIEIVSDMPPRAGDDYATVAEGNAVTIDLAANDTDNENSLDLTSIVITSAPASGIIVAINGDGTVTYTHDGSETTDDSFSYTIKDTNGNVSSDGQVFVTVTPVNDAPVITSDGGGATAAINAAENQTAVTTVTYTDADVPADTILYSIIGGADSALFSIDASGNLSFIAAPDYENPGDVGLNNDYEVQVQVDDQQGGTAMQTITVSITDVNEAPTVSLSNLTATLAEDTDTSVAIKVADITLSDD
ncbi:MAG: hypothetical protein DRQ39_08835, partial [Gammaproteobacteria bacterium]